MQKSVIIPALALSAVVFLFSGSPVRAQEAHISVPSSDARADVLPAKTIDDIVTFSDHDLNDVPTIYLSADKSEVMKLDQDAVSIVVGNSKHLNIVADSPRTLVLIARMPGVSNFSVIGKNGDPILERNVIVAGPEDKFVRIKNTCKSNDRSCKSTNIYYCPDTCHAVDLPDNANETASVTSYEFKDNKYNEADSALPSVDEKETERENFKEDLKEILKAVREDERQDDENADENE